MENDQKQKSWGRTNSKETGINLINFGETLPTVNTIGEESTRRMKCVTNLKSFIRKSFILEGEVIEKKMTIKNRIYFKHRSLLK